MKHSLQHKIADLILTDYINSGRIQPGQKIPTVRELKDIYDTSDTTIQRSLGILELWGVIIRRPGSGCYVSDIREVSLKPSLKILGCVISCTDTETGFHIFSGIETACRQRGYQMLIATTNDDYDMEMESVSKQINMGCNAIVICPAPRTQEQMASDYLKTSFKDFPIVLLDNGFPEQSRSHVIFDNYSAGYKMTEMLIKEGHKRIAFMWPGNNLLIKSVRDRHKGYVDALRAEGIHCNEEDEWSLGITQSIYKGSHDHALRVIKDKLLKFKDNDNHATAVLALEDTLATHTIMIARELGIDVPSQLRVIGFDNQPIARLFTPAFPTTNPDFNEASKIAAEMAIDLATDELPRSMIYVNKLPLPIIRRKA